MAYEDARDAAKAIEDYHGAYLDDKLLTVEYDVKNVVRVPKLKGSNAIGKTLRVQSRR